MTKRWNWWDSIRIRVTWKVKSNFDISFVTFYSFFSDFQVKKSNFRCSSNSISLFLWFLLIFIDFKVEKSNLQWSNNLIWIIFLIFRSRNQTFDALAMQFEYLNNCYLLQFIHAIWLILMILIDQFQLIFRSRNWTYDARRDCEGRVLHRRHEQQVESTHQWRCWRLQDLRDRLRQRNTFSSAERPLRSHSIAVHVGRSHVHQRIAG